MKCIAQAASHHEVELRQPAPGDSRTDAAWRAAWLMRPLRFDTLQAARDHAGRLRPRETRIVAVERDGRRRTVGAEEA